MILQAAVLLFVAGSGTGVALVRDPARQAVVGGIFGLGLVLLFVVLQAPDVALSAVVAGSVALPLLVLLTLAQIGDRER